MTEATHILLTQHDSCPSPSSVALLIRDDVAIADVRETVDEVLTWVREHSDLEEPIAICDDQQFLGTISAAELLRAAPDRTIATLELQEIPAMAPRPILKQQGG